jgi:hypothetical protein
MFTHHIICICASKKQIFLELDVTVSIHLLNFYFFFSQLFAL